MKKTGDYKIPWGYNYQYEQIEPQYYPENWHEWVEDENGEGHSYVHEPEMRDNTPFIDTLECIDYGRGRSAAYFRFKSLLTGIHYYMFLSDLMAIIPLMQEGRISGTFKFAKKGQNYGIQRQGPTGVIDDNSK